jgi:hypothetical protein
VEISAAQQPMALRLAYTPPADPKRGGHPPRAVALPAAARLGCVGGVPSLWLQVGGQPVMTFSRVADDGTPEVARPPLGILGPGSLRRA